MKSDNLKPTLFSKIKPSIYYIIASLFLLYEMGVQSSPSVMANRMMSELNLGAGSLGLAMGCYFFSYTLLQIPVGLLFDRYPAKRLLVMATLACAVGSTLYSFSHGVAWLAFSRFLTGFGSAFAFVGVLVIASQWFHARRFALLVGIAQLLAAVGALVGQRPLAYWVSIWGWRFTMQVLAMIGLGLGFVMLLALRTKHRCSQQEPTLPKVSLQHIASNKQTKWIALYAFTAWAPIAAFAELWAGPFIMTKLKVDSVIAANFTSIIWVALAISSPLLGALSDRMQVRRSFLMLCSTVGLIGVSVLIYFDVTSSLLIYLSMICIGVAASGQILCFALIRDNFPSQDLALAIGIINMSVVIGGALFQPLVGLLLSWHHVGSTHVYTISDFKLALFVLPLCYLLGLLVSVFAIRDIFSIAGK